MVSSLYVHQAFQLHAWPCNSSCKAGYISQEDIADYNLSVVFVKLPKLSGVNSAVSLFLLMGDIINLPVCACLIWLFVCVHART